MVFGDAFNLNDAYINKVDETNGPCASTNVCASVPCITRYCLDEAREMTAVAGLQDESGAVIPGELFLRPLTWVAVALVATESGVAIALEGGQPMPFTNPDVVAAFRAIIARCRGAATSADPQQCP